MKTSIHHNLALSLAAAVTAFGCSSADAPPSDTQVASVASPSVAPGPPYVWSPTPDVERRLRILSGIPTFAQAMLTQAQATFLGQGPTMAFGLVLDDGLFYGQGFSSPTLASANDFDPDASTVYRMGSLNKVFTAAALKRVIELYPSVSPTDLASKYVPEAATINFPVGTLVRRGATPPITLAELVSHTSGLPNFGVDSQGVSIYPPGTIWEKPTEAQFLQMLDKATMLFPAGTQRSYSGVGMTLAGIVIERITGVPYRDWMLANFLQPLGMTNTQFDPSLEPAGSIAAHYSSPSPGVYTYESPATQWDIAALAPAGQLYTTVRDMANMIALELSSAAPATVPDNFLLKRADLVATQTDLFPAATAVGGEPCGWGWFLNGSGQGYVHHNGGKDGYESNTYLSPSNRMGMSLLIGAGDNTNMDAMLGNAMNAAIAADTYDDWHAYPLPVAVERLMTVMNSPYDASTTPSYFTLGFQIGLYNPITHTGTSLDALVASWKQTYGSCKTFTVERASTTTHAEVTLKCSKQDMKVALTASAASPFQIAGASTFF